MTEKENKVNQLAKEVSDLNFKIKLDTIRLKKIKEQLIDLMVNENVSEIITDTSKIKKSKWSVRFSTQLRKEFNKLEDKKKEELLSKGLIKIQYKLNTKNFGELKNKQEKTELDEYIIDKKNQIFLTIKLNENSKKELENEIETKDYNYDERIDLEESFLEEEEILKEINEEDYIDYDLAISASSDDDVSDLSEVEKQDLGVSDNDYEDNNLRIEDEEK
tara:strand:+ start:70 stop:726 length:657 start_codon:yes stop_codon:yes gene_type:complete